MKPVRQILLIGAFLCLPLAPSAANMIGQYPDAIVCKSSKSRVVLYLDRRLSDGTVYYKTLDGVRVTVAANGVVRGENAQDCAGMTLIQLRKRGQAFHFIGPR